MSRGSSRGGTAAERARGGQVLERVHSDVDGARVMNAGAAQAVASGAVALGGHPPPARPAAQPGLRRGWRRAGLGGREQGGRGGHADGSRHERPSGPRRRPPRRRGRANSSASAAAWTHTAPRPSTSSLPARSAGAAASRRPGAVSSPALGAGGLVEVGHPGDQPGQLWASSTTAAAMDRRPPPWGHALVATRGEERRDLLGAMCGRPRPRHRSLRSRARPRGCRG